MHDLFAWVILMCCSPCRALLQWPDGVPFVRTKSMSISEKETTVTHYCNLFGVDENKLAITKVTVPTTKEASQNSHRGAQSWHSLLAQTETGTIMAKFAKRTLRMAGSTLRGGRVEGDKDQ